MRSTVVAMLVVALPAFAQPGEEWEISVEITMPGMPPGTVPPTTSRSCAPKRTDAMPFNPSMMQKANGCLVSEPVKAGSTWSWKLSCEGGVSGTGKITLEGKDAFSGESTMVIQDQNMTSKMKGKKVGLCDYQGPAPTPARKK
jgi:hypothetical protein